MNVRNKIDVTKALRLSGLNLGLEKDAITERLTVLRDDPYALNQIAGCCGFNVILSLLLLHGDTEVFSNLLKLIWGAHEKHSANHLKGLEQAKAKYDTFYGAAPTVQRNVSVRELTKNNKIDALLSLALMQYFNRYCKKYNAELWHECEVYSQTWNWQKGLKIKDVVLGSSQNYLSYKKGDFGLTSVALMTLLNCFGAKFTSSYTVCTGQVEADIAIQNARNWARGFFAIHGRYIIAAVNTNGWTDMPINKRLYNYVNHWVTVPRVSSSESTKLVATWGTKEERDHAIREVHRIQYTGKIDPIET